MSGPKLNSTTAGHLLTPSATLSSGGRLSASDNPFDGAQPTEETEEMARQRLEAMAAAALERAPLADQPVMRTWKRGGAFAPLIVSRVYLVTVFQCVLMQSACAVLVMAWFFLPFTGTRENAWAIRFRILAMLSAAVYVTVTTGVRVGERCATEQFWGMAAAAGEPGPTPTSALDLTLNLAILLAPVAIVLPMEKWPSQAAYFPLFIYFALYWVYTFFVPVRVAPLDPARPAKAVHADPITFVCGGASLRPALLAAPHTHLRHLFWSAGRAADIAAQADRFRSALIKADKAQQEAKDGAKDGAEADEGHAE